MHNQEGAPHDPREENQLPAARREMSRPMDAVLRRLPEPQPEIGYDRLPVSVAGLSRGRSSFGLRPVAPTKRHDVSERGGSDAAAKRLEDLVSEYGHVVRAAVRKAGGGAADAEDVEQSVLLEVWKQVRREQEIQFPSSYLYRAAVRETVRLMARRRTRNEEPLDAGRLAPPDTAGRRGKLEVLELREAIAACLGGLAPDRRKAVAGHLAGYRVGEIMQRYDWSYSRARNLIARGMADLRDKLRALGVDR
jgi:RNA polymerase sigma factor (sigma-70 family)